MRVLLMSTPYPLEENPLPPLSLSYLAAALQLEGIDVKILDLLVARDSARKIKEVLAEYQPDIVGATCVTLNYPVASRNLKVCKDFDNHIVTMLGGPHASFALNETLLRAGWIDLVVIGEGERTIVELAKTLDSGKDIRQVAGIALREDNTVVKTEPRPLIEDLDELPIPARHLLPLSKYHALGNPCTLITSRGCPYRCIFCSGPRLFGRRVRFRNPKLVVDEIEYVNTELGFEQINIVDDTFTINHRHAQAVCDEIMSRNLKLKWCIFARADTVTAELMHSMKQAGCNYVLYGAESASPQILKTIKKGTTLDDLRRGTKIATEAGIDVFNSFIFGLPGETPETARQSLAFARELNREYDAKYGFHMLSPLPGTELYDRPEDYGLRILTRNWSKYNANEPITETDTMSPEQVLECMADYNHTIETVWEDIEHRAAEGDPECVRELKQIDSAIFAWRLLKEDVVERVGRMKDGADPIRQLAQRVSAKMKVPLDVAEREMGSLVEKGFLKHELSNGGILWRWS